MVAAVIGGTGVESWPDAQMLEQRVVATPFGEPSAPLYHYRLGSADVWFLSRHGETHSIAPHRINYRANIYALHALGVVELVALNAVGVIGGRCPPGQLGLPDQLIDYTHGRDDSFFDGVQAPLQHVEFTEPYSSALRAKLLAAASTVNVALADGGIYAATQGPRLETRAEVDRLAHDGAEYIGMTGYPEAVLARELGLDYASLALSVNQAAGRSDEPIHAALQANMDAARGRAVRVIRQWLTDSA